MLARCISNDFGTCRGNIDLVEFLGLNATFESHAPLVVGQEYLVIAFAFGPFVPWLFIADRLGLRYPLIYPSCMFSITDTRLSREWERSFWMDSRGGKSQWLAPQVLVEAPGLPGAALEGDLNALATFGNLVSIMSLEFSLPWINECAVALDKDIWVTDADYSESWQVDISNEMTLRPSTGALLHNPLHQNLR
jgi:hypothetical protein